MAARTLTRAGRWLVSGPPLLYLVVFFAIPSLIMVLASFLIAPIGVGAASVELWRARRRSTGAPPLATAMLGVNLLFLLVEKRYVHWSGK